MAQSKSAGQLVEAAEATPPPHQPRRGRRAVRETAAPPLIAAAFEAERGLPKAHAARLIHRIAASSPLPMGKVRAELIPDSSWKRAGKTLGPQASQTAARVEHVLAFATNVWGNEAAATRWLNRPHMELGGRAPISLLKTEAGGRAVEAILGALEYGFPA